MLLEVCKWFDPILPGSSHAFPSREGTSVPGSHLSVGFTAHSYIPVTEEVKLQLYFNKGHTEFLGND